MINLIIHPTDCQKCKVEENILKRANLEEKNKNVELKAFEKSVESIFNKIKNVISNSCSHRGECYTVDIKDFYTYTYKTLNDEYVRSVNKTRVLSAVQTAFETAGYEFEWLEYSDSWQYQSGKFCKVTVFWSK